jgi:hypothetical protein
MNSPIAITAESLRVSCADASPPAALASHALAALLKSMWLVERGHWDAAHALAQEDDSESGAWVHAYLHRVEGDLSNAGFWYGRAGRPRCEADLALEWSDIVSKLLVLES